jgi:hypothetical protein
MAIWFQILLAVLAVALVAFLVPLILQLTRTARSVQVLAESAREDLNRIAGDVHEVRQGLDQVVSLVERSLELPAVAGALAATVVRSFTSLLDRRPAPWVDALVTAVKFGIDFLKRPREAAPAKETNDE